jgi:NitT/TauT family transport system permease protein
MKTGDMSMQTVPDLIDRTKDDQVFLLDPSIKARRREVTLVVVSRIAISILGLALWELVSGRWVSDFWVSSPSHIFQALLAMWHAGGLFRNIYATVGEGLAGFAFGSALGMFMGIALGANRVLAKIVDPFLIGFYSIPRVALIPLFILWFGIGLQTKVIYTSILVFFPVFLNTLSGIRDVNQDLIDVLRVMGASRADTMKKVLIPSALAWLFAGIRISAPYALVGAVVSEMFTSNVGLGYLISNYANQLDTASLFATLAVTTALGLLLNAVVARVEKRMLRWKPAPGGGH